MKKINTLKVMLIMVFIFHIIHLQGSNSDIPPQIAPLNPEFLKYKKDLREGKYQILSCESHPLGYIPSPVDLSHVIGIMDKNVDTSYPTRYDLRTQNRLTPVKNQGDCGSCWAFASLASLESVLKSSETWDFSEQHLNANHGFDFPECEGGFAEMSAAYFIRWDGPIKESDTPYPYDATYGVKGYSVQKHIQQVIFLPTRANSLDNNTIKYFITNYGAAYVAFKYDGGYFTDTYDSYYYDGEKETNHAVAVVGWDDNFPANKFKVTPPGNGAFIVRNSWGIGWGDDGYFYLSYYDTSMGYFCSFNGAEAPNNYQKNYQFDPLGETNGCGWNDTVAWGANIFTAKDTLPMRAVGFYLNDANVKYEIYVYKGVKAGSPRSGTLAVRKSGNKTYPGYYTEKLDSTVSLKSGERFSVVIKFMNSNYTYPVPIEYPVDDYSSGAAANKGESFLSHNGTNWYDAAVEMPGTNVCIKAFTGGSSSGSIPVISCNRKTLNFGCVPGGSVTCSQSLRITNSGKGTLKWTLSKSADTGWLNYNPASGTNSGAVNISILSSGLNTGTYTGYLDIIDPNASNSPQTITVILKVTNSEQSKVPFGEFSTPASGSGVVSNVPMTGWALDDIEIASVKIYNSSNYLGDAVFIEGARPDVEQAYQDYPFNYKAGWGYMLLTNFLPNGGNGTYNIYAYACDKEGHVVTLGYKRITCYNAAAVKPFGTIDTPIQGGIASGKKFMNWGWVLTPRPNYIPLNGSTIDVFVDGVKIGNPLYNLYRADIANLFPGYLNSDGAVGYFTLDTTRYKDGVHTIYWIATDSAGTSDGIGSRYFTIQNVGNTLDSENDISMQQSGEYHSVSQIVGIPVSHFEQVKFRKGYNEKSKFQKGKAFERDTLHIEIREEEPLEIYLKGQNSQSPDINFTGYQLVGNQLKNLPIGSTLDLGKGIFYWIPPVGFIGDYKFIFVVKESSGAMTQTKIHVKIFPKF